MGHITKRTYSKLQKRLNRSAQGAPASDTLFEILKVLFTEEEAGLASVLPLNKFTAKKAAKRWKKSVDETIRMLETLADKGILLDIQHGDTKKYLLAPTMAGFIEFSIMRTDGKFNRETLSKLYYQYINVEEKFIKQIFNLDPSIARVFVQEESIQPKDNNVVLSYERVSHIVNTASCITVGECYCRHKMQHVGKGCDKPQDVCLTFNMSAESLAKHGIAKQIDKKEAMAIIDQCVKLGLVQIGDNVQEGVNWICNCCSCCCEALLAYKKLGARSQINNNFTSKVDSEKCINCGICVTRCPVDAIKLDGDKIQIDENKCIGCGVCVNFCPNQSLKLERSKKITFVPKDSMERMILEAINAGKLQNLVFDNYDLWTYDLLREFLGIVLKLKPVQWALANNQLNSRYIRVARGVYNKLNQK